MSRARTDPMSQSWPVDTEALWAGVDPPWREAFALAWEAYQAGSPPVGAVVVGPDSRVVARGRSRRAERSGPPNQLYGSRLAHAEVNALAQLDVDQHTRCRLYVTLEPCLLCWAAISIARIPEVCFAGEDPMWRFLGDLGDSHAALADRRFTTVGPLAGLLGAWSSLLPLVDRLLRDPTGIRVDHFRTSLPALAELADRLVSDGRAKSMTEMTMSQALASVWDDLQSLAEGHSQLGS